MKHTRILTILLVAAMLLAICAGCGQKEAAEAPQQEATQTPPAETPKQEEAPAQDNEQPKEPEASTGVTVVDMKGREITLDKPAERIVALTASDCEILYAIGAGDTLVGRGTYCDYPAEVLEVPAVESGATTNVEEIIALKPDVLLMSDMAQSEEQIQQLEAAGVKVVVSEATDIEGVYTAIEADRCTYGQG